MGRERGLLAGPAIARAGARDRSTLTGLTAFRGFGFLSRKVTGED
ncbi:MAG: hypothetical protein Q7S58_06540 [Candidatus Binatus sp.]|nr:hypothetical protein [Candidatus Binatus sp.]MDO8432055.1 hypothetical protein [Candidatus Binatus sp.]